MRPKTTNRECRKVASVSLLQSLLDRCREIDPYFNLSQEVEKTMLKFIADRTKIDTTSDKSNSTAESI